MANPDPNVTLQASLLDRLIDPESDGTGSRPGCTVEQIIDSVRRDLEDLLNTHRTLLAIPDEYKETENSILSFGLPDFSSFQSSKADVGSRVAERIEQAIARHEPRLRNVRATQMAFQHNQNTLELGLRMAETLRDGVEVRSRLRSRLRRFCVSAAPDAPAHGKRDRGDAREDGEHREHAATPKRRDLEIGVCNGRVGDDVVWP